MTASDLSGADMSDEGISGKRTLGWQKSPLNWLRQRWQAWLDRRMPARTRITLQQHEIFIFFARPGLFFLALTLLLAVAAFNFQSNMGLVLAFLLASFGLLSPYISYRNFRDLQLQAQAGAPVFAGEPAPFQVHLRGAPAQSYEALGLGVDGVVQIWCDVAADQTTVVALKIATRQRGWLDLPRLYLCSYFPLGWWRCWTWPLLSARTLVYPRPIEIDQWPSASGEGSGDKTGTERGSDDFAEHRRYQPGDSLRQVDWKVWARERGLLTRSFVTQASAECCLRLQDLPGADHELRLSWLTYLVLQAETEGLRYRLQLPQFDSGMGQGDGHRGHCLQALALA